MREQRKRAEDANRICSIVHENAENTGSSLVEAEMVKLMHQDEQELLSAWEGWHWDDNKGGWLDPELCAKARREEKEYIRRHKMYARGPREVCWRKPTKDSQGSLMCARDGLRRNTRHTPDHRAGVDTAIGGAESRAV